MIPLRVDLALLIRPLLLRADILPLRFLVLFGLLTGVEDNSAVFALGFVKFDAGIARITARPDGLARGSEQLGGGGGGMCHARA